MLNTKREKIRKGNEKIKKRVSFQFLRQKCNYHWVFARAQQDITVYAQLCIYFICMFKMFPVRNLSELFIQVCDK